ncbi:MAG: hypothetical protein ABH830_03725 [Patescibacteria group bacterium]
MWVKWAFFEGVCRSINTSLMKFVGQGNTLPGSFFITSIIGFIQMIGGWIIALFRKEKIIMPFSKIYRSIIFGVSASLMTILSIYTFTYAGAEVGIVSFLVMLSIIPGTIIDRLLFFEKIPKRKIIGIFLYLFTAFIFLEGYKGSGLLFTFPIWLIFPLANAFLLAINEGLTKKISRQTSPFVNNFYIGLTTVIFSFVGYKLLNVAIDFKQLSFSFWIGVFFIGLVVILLIASKFLAYYAGGNIAVKQLVTSSAFLIIANFFGVIFFQESWTLGKTLGLPLFIISFLVAHREAWEYFKLKIVKNKLA